MPASIGKHWPALALTEEILMDYITEKVKLLHGDCLAVLKELPDNSIDSIVADPPYGLKFLGKKWDYDVPGVDVWRECLRVLKPGGHLLSFSGSRTYHRMTVAIEDAGFEIRDQIMWVYGCLDEQTEVATSDGVKPYHKTKVGDTVLCYNPDNGEYSYQPILEIVEYEYSDTAYRLVGDFGEQVVSRNHRCIVERDGSEAFMLAETLECEARVPILEDLPALQQAIHDAHAGAGCAKQGVQQSVRAWDGHKTAMVRVVPFHHAGKVWCLRVPTGAFVAVRNGVAFPTGNSGFPKSLDVSRAIDKAAGAEREVGPVDPVRAARLVNQQGGYETAAGWSVGGRKVTIDPPATDAARQWQGWGSALKPAHEPICVARKPLIGTVAANVLEYGTGAINIDGCRVGDEVLPSVTAGQAKIGTFGRGVMVTPERVGRWPANFIHDGSEEVTNLLGDAARFFYCSKASKKDRGEGNSHPTIKPTNLMRYLCRLVTTPGGVVLDPFLGSGSTGVAALAEGFRFVGIEREAEYMAIATARIRKAAEAQ